MGGKIHTTIGLYANGTYVVNGVLTEDLDQHIYYNKNWRPERALFVDGKCVHQGYISNRDCDEFARNVASNRVELECTAPYI